MNYQHNTKVRDIDQNSNEEDETSESDFGDNDDDDDDELLSELQRQIDEQLQNEIDKQLDDYLWKQIDEEIEQEIGINYSISSNSKPQNEGQTDKKHEVITTRTKPVSVPDINSQIQDIIQKYKESSLSEQNDD